MPSSEVRLKKIYVYGANLPSHEGSGFFVGNVQVWMRRDSRARIELVYELAEENRFVVVPRQPNTKMVTHGRNNSRKFRVELSGTHVIDQVKLIGQEQDESGITRILRPYFQLTSQLRVEAANSGQQMDQGYTHVNKLMPINNLTIKGLVVPFASDPYDTRVRTYVIDGVTFGIEGPMNGFSPSIVTAVKLPNRHHRIIVRPGHNYPESPKLYVTYGDKSFGFRPTVEVSVEGAEVVEFLRSEHMRQLNSPREVWAAIQQYYTFLRLNFRIRPDSR